MNALFSNPPSVTTLQCQCCALYITSCMCSTLCVVLFHKIYDHGSLGFLETLCREGG